VQSGADAAAGGAGTGKLLLACKHRLAYCAVVADVFDALAAPARRAILDVLTDRNDQTLFELCGRLVTQHEIGLTRQAVSQHLAVLEEAGLVRSRRDGRYKFHSVDTAPLRAAVSRWLDHEETPE
jgi:DNA-binding transcriptional ArsR family regulator